MGRIPKGWFWVIAGILLVVLFLWSFTPKYQYHHWSICSKCTAIEYSTDHFMPIIGLPTYVSHRIAKSALCEVIEKNHLVGPHRHVWQDCGGSGGGVRCSIGAWAYTDTAARDPNVVKFIQLLITYRGKETAKRYIDSILLNDGFGRNLQMAIMDVSIPITQVKTKENFERWLEMASEDQKILPAPQGPANSK